MKVALFGARGYWGRKLHRVLASLGQDVVCTINENGSDRVGYARGLGARAAIVATPPATHYPIVKRALLEGMDVFVEKPVALCLEHARELSDLAGDSRAILRIDHTFLFTEPFDYLRKLGPPDYFFSQRLSPPFPQAKIPVSWDLVVHDVAILDALGTLFRPTLARADVIASEETAMARFQLVGGGEAFVSASRCHHEKVRSIILRYGKEIFHWDGPKLRRRSDDGWAVVAEDVDEPLRRAVAEFVLDCGERTSNRLNDGSAGRRVSWQLEAAFGQA